MNVVYVKSLFRNIYYKIMRITHKSLQGKRPYNEDRLFIFLNQKGEKPNLPKLNLFCVFDGHGGDKVSQYLKDNFYKLILNEKEFPLTENRIISICDTMQKNINEQKFGEIGSTACILIQYCDDKFQVINIGDSKVSCIKNNKCMSLCRIHKPNMIYEKERIDKINKTAIKKQEIYDDGGVYRIVDLSVSRSFGDSYANPYVIHEPDIYNYNEKFDYIVLGSDGVWDEMTDDEVYHFINNNINKSRNISEELANYAINVKNSDDNTSVIILDFNKKN